MGNLDSSVMKRIFITALLMAAVSCQWGGGRSADAGKEDSVAETEVVKEVPRKAHYVDVDRRDSLTIYRPIFKRIDLVTENMPSKDEEDVILCFEAAFTGELLDDFKHFNIAGHHVSGGVFYKGYKCGPNNGVFTWDSKTGWHFYNYGHANSEAVLKKVAEKGGMGFCQSLLIHEGKRFKGCFKPESRNIYRALCELDGRLCVIDCAFSMPFGQYLDALMTMGVKEAIYCDMGTGWNYSWYRDEAGSVKEIFHTPGRYTTNWVTFY